MNIVGVSRIGVNRKMVVGDVIHAYGYDGDNVGLVDVSDVERRDRMFAVRKVPFFKSQVEMIPVTRKRSAEKAANDDLVVTVLRSKNGEESFARMATIGDGSCMMHAFLKCVYSRYQEETSYDRRRELAREVRSYMATLIDRSDVSNPGSWYRRIGVDHDPNYSKAKLVDLLDSDEYLGEVAANLLSTIFKVNILFFELKSSNVEGVERPKLRSYVALDGNHSTSIGIIYVGENHFEPLVLRTEHGIQTKFVGSLSPLHRLYSLLK